MDKDWEVVKIGEEYTFRNEKTGKLCSQRFREADIVNEGWAVVETENGQTYFNPNTKELCRERFVSARCVSEGWAWVRTENGLTFFNPNTKELCSQRFREADIVNEGWAWVRTEDGYTFFNPNTKELCSQRFVDARREKEGCAIVKTKDGWTFFNPELDMQFQSMFVFDYPMSIDYRMSIETCLREHPEDFALLPTVRFRDATEIESYLNAAAEGVKAQCSEKGATEEVEKFANEIKTLIANKIKSEKAKIASDDPQAKIKVAEKAADEIKNLGSLLNDDETEV